MIVNATSIGFGKMKHKIPIDIKKNAVKIVYDIILQSKKTALIKNLVNLKQNNQRNRYEPLSSTFCNKKSF